MSPVPTFASLDPFKWVTCAYLFVASASMYAWLFVTGRAASWIEIAICVLPPLLGVVLAVTSQRDRRQYVARLLACVVFTPFLLLFWGTSVDVATGPVSSSGVSNISGASPAPAAGRLDQDRLFAGAVATQDVPLQAGTMTLLRGGAFRDASELRLMRFADTASAGQYLAMLARTLQGERVTLQGRSGVRLGPAPAGNSSTVFVEQHGSDLLEVRAATETLAVTRLVAQGVPEPAAAAPRSAIALATSSQAAPPATPVWPFAIAYSALHILAFVLLVVWSGAALTRVQPADNVAPITQADLSARLASLVEPEVPARLVEGPTSGELVFDYRFPAGMLRSHRISLRIDADRRVVRVRETTSASGDAPRSAKEADMRAPGSVGIDPTRPDASQVWNRTRQTTMIEADRLAAIPLQMHRTRAQLEEALPEWTDPASGADPAKGPEALIHLLCAVVVRSGFVWQPVFFK